MPASLVDGGDGCFVAFFAGVFFLLAVFFAGAIAFVRTSFFCTCGSGGVDSVMG